MKFSNLQKDIFKFCKNETGSAIIQAVAGSGKSTTIVEAMKLLKGNSLFLAFNKAIATELKERGVNARTFHSLTYSVMTKHMNVRDVDTGKVMTLMRDSFTPVNRMMYGNFCVKLVGLAKQSGVGCLVEMTLESMMNIINHHGLEIDAEGGSHIEGAGLAIELLRLSNAARSLDFDDLLYLPVFHKIKLQTFDNILVDESQDTNAIQRELLKKISHKKTRIIAVGDTHQAIYGFRGADSDSMNLIQEEFNCKPFPLSISYRCAKNIIKMAQYYVPHIEHRADAPDGIVTDLGTSYKNDVFKAGDLIVSRTTRPLIALAYSLLKEKIPVTVLGREIGAGLMALVKKVSGKFFSGSVDELAVLLGNYRVREVRKFMDADQEARAQALSDKCETILYLIESLPESDRTLTALSNVIDELFKDKKNARIFATIHKSKGLEANRVYWLGYDQCPAKWAKQPWEKDQELNLCYVAITRAKNELYLIRDRG